MAYLFEIKANSEWSAYKAIQQLETNPVFDDIYHYNGIDFFHAKRINKGFLNRVVDEKFFKKRIDKQERISHD